MTIKQKYLDYLDSVSLYARAIIRRELEEEYTLTTISTARSLPAILRMACLLTTYNELFDGRVFFKMRDFNPNN